MCWQKYMTDWLTYRSKTLYFTQLVVLGIIRQKKHVQIQVLTFLSLFSTHCKMKRLIYNFVLHSITKDIFTQSCFIFQVILKFTFLLYSCLAEVLIVMCVLKKTFSITFQIKSRYFFFYNKTMWVIYIWIYFHWYSADQITVDTCVVKQLHIYHSLPDWHFFS